MKGLIIRLALPVFILAITSITITQVTAQCISGNCRTGHGTYRFKNGDEYKGEWNNGQPHGSGTYTFVSKEMYHGQFQNGKFEGQGSMFYPGGASYSGSWSANKKHGKGTLKDASGKYTKGTWNMGTFVAPEDESTTASSAPASNKPKPTPAKPASTKPNNKPQTQTPVKPAPSKPTTQSTTAGKPKSKNDVSGLRNCNQVFCSGGNGYFDYPDGSRWIGEFRDGYPAGKGFCYYSNGDRYEGQWANNAPNGEGIMYFASGRVYGAVWAAGAPVRELDSDEVMPSDPVKIEATTDVKIWAVVVGVGRYTSMPSLKFTDDDAFRFYSFLKSPEGGALQENQIEILVDESATRDNILKTMRTMFLKADDNDVVILYFSGHGLEGCFLPVDFDGYNNKLRHEEVKQVFKSSKAKHKLCIADACHSGSLSYGEGLAAKGPATVSLKRFYQAFEDADGGIALLMSSQSEELSLEDHGLRQGVFTYYVLQGLKGKADNNGDKLVTIKELYNYVYKSVREYTAGMQTPVLTGNYDDAMPVSVPR
jgi:hypothetical protein